MDSNDKISVTLGKHEALVLFEMLANFQEQPCLDVRDHAQRLSLVRLHGALESVLVETFLPEYGSLIDEARSSLATPGALDTKTNYLMLDLEFAELSDTGPTRENNEDCCGHFVPATPEAAQSRGWCFAIADGVGGQAGGEVASRLAIETLLSRLPSVSSTESLTLALPRLIQVANQRIFEAAADVVERGRRAGSIASTIVACAIRYDRATVAHVGDSRCYLIRRGEVSQLTRDHTVANEHRRLGILTSRQASSAATKNLLSRSLGNELVVNVDTSDHLLSAGDALLLCSDGLYRTVTPGDIASAVSAKNDIEAAATRLVSLANARDGNDNVSVQIIRIKSVESVGMYRGRLYKLPRSRYE